MSCISCAKPYTIFRKEKGCPNCGFSYCSNCLNNKVFVVKLNSEAKVCWKCKKLMSNEDQNAQKNIVIPPDTFLKRLADSGISLTNNPTDDQISERLNKLKQDKEKIKSREEEIQERLKNLKGETSTATSNAEIEARLARLRGLPETVTSKTTLPVVVDTRSEQEQIDDLMKQYMEQTQIDTKYKDEFDNLVTDMETRINKLKGSNADNVHADKKKAEESESEDEETTVKKIVEKIKTEASLEDHEIGPSTNDELPFCEICNEDATMRCIGCKYLFCKRCWKDHKDDDDGCDQYEPYKPPRQ